MLIALSDGCTCLISEDLMGCNYLSTINPEEHKSLQSALQISALQSSI